MRIINISRCKFGVQIILATRKFYERRKIKPGDDDWPKWNAIAKQLVDTKWNPEDRFTVSLFLDLPELTEVDMSANEVQLSFEFKETNNDTATT